MNISGIETIFAVIYFLLAGIGVWLLALARQIHIDMKNSSPFRVDYKRLIIEYSTYLKVMTVIVVLGIILLIIGVNAFIWTVAT